MKKSALLGKQCTLYKTPKRSSNSVHYFFSFCLARKEFVNFLTESYKLNFIVCYTSVFTTNLQLLDYIVIMASPGSLKGQRRGTCGHAMAAFDLHEKCARCHEKKIGDDLCIKGLSCILCERFSEA